MPIDEYIETKQFETRADMVSFWKGCFVIVLEDLVCTLQRFNYDCIDVSFELVYVVAPFSHPLVNG